MARAHHRRMTDLSDRPPPRPSRRLVTLAAVSWPWWPATAATPRRPTPSQTEGPFYPVAFGPDTDFDLLRNGTRAPYDLGTPVWLTGQVLDLDGRPVRGAQVEIWQCDQQGRYHHPGDRGAADPRFQGFGRVAVDADGHYRFRTLRPAPYAGRTPHIHVKVRQGGRELLTTQLYVAGDPGNLRDGLWRSLPDEGRAALTRPITAGAEGPGVRFPIVVAA